MSYAISLAALFASVFALAVSLCDRWPKLVLKARKGNWCKLWVIQNELRFAGIVEVYNSSSRTNAIRDYAFSVKREKEGWELMKSELTCEANRKVNPTPFIVMPNSGVEVEVGATGSFLPPYTRQVRIEVEDLFGKRYRLDIEAKS